MLGGCAVTVLLTLTACGNGGGPAGTTTKDGFTQAAQDDGALTV
ncbi:hypothetical protein [Streptomyces sp. NPDC057257]